MNYKLVFIINAIVVFAFGLLLFIAPTVGLKQFNMDARATDVFLTRVIGAVLASLGLLLWFAQNADEDVQRWMGIAALAGSVLALIVTLIGVGSGIVRAMRWIPIVLEILSAFAYAFLIFLQPKMQE